jgi:hypothetical protein
MRSAVRLGLFGGLALAVAAASPRPAAAAADCASVLEKLKPLAARIADPDLRLQVLFDLRRARFEIREDDEDECAMWVIHAARLMGCRTC